MKFRRQGVKREHSVITGYAPLFERLARIPGVDGIIPGRIAHNPTHHPGLVLKAETQTGFKLLAKTTSSVQEVFLIAGQSARPAVRVALQPLLARPAQAAPERGRPPKARGAVPPRTAAPSRPPLPEGSRPAPRHRPNVGEQLTGPVRRRLLVLRLKGARWRRRFGNRARRVRRHA